MRLILLVIAFISTSLVRADNMPKNDEEFLQMMRAKAEQQQAEEEYKNPKKPEIAKDRAVRGSRKAPLLSWNSPIFSALLQAGFETVEQVRDKYKGKTLFMFKHMPLPFHPMAMPAAKRFEAIALQNPIKAYGFHDEVFKTRKS